MAMNASFSLYVWKRISMKNKKNDFAEKRYMVVVSYLLRKNATVFLSLCFIQSAESRLREWLESSAGLTQCTLMQLILVGMKFSEFQLLLIY